MSKNAELMSTAPSCFVRDTCPPSVSGKSSGQTEHSLHQVTAPSFLHVTPKYYYLRLVIPLIVCNLVWAVWYGISPVIWFGAKSVRL